MQRLDWMWWWSGPMLSCLLMLLLVLHHAGCSDASAERDLQTMQNALWQARAAVRDDRPDTLLQAMGSFNDASIRAKWALNTILDTSRTAAGQRWSALRRGLIDLLDSPHGRKIVQRLTRDGGAAQFIEFQTELTTPASSVHPQRAHGD